MTERPNSRGDLRDQISQIRGGLPVQHALELMEEWGISLPMFSRLLGISDRSMSRLRLGDPCKLLSAVETDRLVRVESLLIKAQFVLEGAAPLWLQSPAKALGDDTPVSLMDTGIGCRQVDLVLSRIQHAVVS